MGEDSRRVEVAREALKLLHILWKSRVTRQVTIEQPSLPRGHQINLRDPHS